MTACCLQPEESCPSLCEKQGKILNSVHVQCINFYKSVLDSSRKVLCCNATNTCYFCDTFVSVLFQVQMTSSASLESCKKAFGVYKNGYNYFSCVIFFCLGPSVNSSPELKMSFHPLVIPNMYDYLSSTKHKKRYLTECPSSFFPTDVHIKSIWQYKRLFF